jgi:hypothetical protein
MRRTATLMAVLLVGMASLSVGVAGALSRTHGEGRTAVALAAHDPGEPDGAGAPSVKGTPDAQGGGPPPWAPSVSKDKANRDLTRWKRLSPAEREELMMRLAEEHRAGVQTYHACRHEGRDDCSKPLPPGLAKRR